MNVETGKITDILKDNTIDDKELKNFTDPSLSKNIVKQLEENKNNQDLQNVFKGAITKSIGLDRKVWKIRVDFKNSIKNTEKYKDIISSIDKVTDNSQDQILQKEKKEQEEKEKLDNHNILISYLALPPLSDGSNTKTLFETQEGRFNALFTKEVQDEIKKDVNLQKNITQYLQKYLEKDDIKYDNIQFLTTTKSTVTDPNIDKIQSTKYPEETHIIKIKDMKNIEITFGTQRDIQEKISKDYLGTNEKKKTDKINEIKTQINTGENNTAIINFLNEKGAFVTLEKTLQNDPTLLQTILKNGFIESLSQSENTYKTWMDSENKKIEEANKSLAKENKKPLIELEDIKKIINEQKDGYLNTINKAVITGIETPGMQLDSPQRLTFAMYLDKCQANPGILGSSLDQKIASWNNIVNSYGNFVTQNQSYLQALDKNSTEYNTYANIDKNLALMKKYIHTEGNKEYGTVAQLQNLFAEFKDEIVTVLEFLGFDKESLLHRGGNALKKTIEEAYAKAFKLEDKDKYIITNIHTSGKVAEALGEIKKYNPAKNTTQDILTAFRTGQVPTLGEENTETTTTVDFKSAYIDTLKTISDTQVDGTFIRALIDNHNKNASNKLNTDEYLGANDQVTGDWTNVLEKTRNDSLIWDTIGESSDALQAMANKTHESSDKTTGSAYTEASKYTIQAMGGANPMTAVSYYLSTMIMTGSKDLKYKISENAGKNSKTETTTKPTENDEKAKASFIIDEKLATEKDKVYTITAEGAKKQIHEVIDTSKGPEVLVITDNGKDQLAIKGKEGDTDTYLDPTSGTRVKILAGYTIKEATPEQIGEATTTYTISTVKEWNSKNTNTNTQDYQTNYKANVTKPIFNLFTNENTYNYMYTNNAKDQTIQDPKTFKAFFDYAQKQDVNKNNNITLENITQVDIKAKEANQTKITFEITTNSSGSKKTLTINNTGKFEEIKAITS